ncbi:MAG TPA: DUF488 domain-containing protein [Candidatus Krumholzibacteria bacterium]|nr:DUF488 domain-containing protein [Candidatus Krumholzibacteria bacterium]
MPRVFTIGHSTLSLDVLLESLRAHGIGQLADVRSVPASRRHPHMSRVSLQAVLPAAGMGYRWLPGLGGLRRSGPVPSPNTAWREEAFRAYADHMATPEFTDALEQLEVWARELPTACMCAEADFRRCHRQLLSDALVARGWRVIHVLSREHTTPHVLSATARIGAAGSLSYPGEPQLPL